MSDESKKIYIVKEDSFWNYLLKVDVDKKVMEALLFNKDKKDTYPFLTRAMMCEYYAILGNLQELLDQIDDPDFFSAKDKCYYITETQTVRFTVYLEALVNLKHRLAREGYSISLH